jgi:4-hydroxybenzoate polyprenyltransferase
MQLPIPKLSDITSEWIIVLLVSCLVGYRFREVVVKADPAHSLVAFDNGLLVGAAIFYTLKFIGPSD